MPRNHNTDIGQTTTYELVSSVWNPTSAALLVVGLAYDEPGKITKSPCFQAISESHTPKTTPLNMTLLHHHSCTWS
jgi:hypothetical protein